MFSHVRPLRSCLSTALTATLGILLCGLWAGCSPAEQPQGYGNYGGYGSVVPEFNHDALPNAQPVENFEQLKFVSVQGEEVDLQQYLGKKNVVLVITRGLTGTADGPPNYSGQICLYCATQTSRMVANYPEFQKRNAEVVIVFPVIKSEQATRIEDFERQVQSTGGPADKLPFPLLLDVELKVVDALGIRQDLSKPATYILDQAGNVRYAYVGGSMADRPSAKAILNQLDEINQAATTTNPAPAAAAVGN